MALGTGNESVPSCPSLQGVTVTYRDQNSDSRLNQAQNRTESLVVIFIFSPLSQGTVYIYDIVRGGAKVQSCALCTVPITELSASFI